MDMRSLVDQLEALDDDVDHSDKHGGLKRFHNLLDKQSSDCCAAFKGLSEFQKWNLD